MVAFPPEDNRPAATGGLRLQRCCDAVMVSGECPSGGLWNRTGDTYLLERRRQPCCPSLPFTQTWSSRPDYQGTRYVPQDFAEGLDTASMGGWLAPQCPGAQARGLPQHFCSPTPLITACCCSSQEQAEAIYSREPRGRGGSAAG